MNSRKNPALVVYVPLSIVMIADRSMFHQSGNKVFPVQKVLTIWIDQLDGSRCWSVNSIQLASICLLTDYSMSYHLKKKKCWTTNRKNGLRGSLKKDITFVNQTFVSCVPFSLRQSHSKKIMQEDWWVLQEVYNLFQIYHTISTCHCNSVNLRLLFQWKAQQQRLHE